MAKTILVVATRQGSGLTSAVLGLYHALDRKGIKVGFHKPVIQYDVEGQEIDHSRSVLRHSARTTADDSLAIRPETLSRLLKQLEQEAVLTWDQRGVTVHDWAKLKDA